MKYLSAKRRPQRSAPRRGTVYRLNVRENPVPSSYAIRPAESAPRRLPRLDHQTAPYTYPSQREELQTEKAKSGSGKIPVLGRFRLRVADEAQMPGLMGSVRLRCDPKSVDTIRASKGQLAFVADHDSTKILGKIDSLACEGGNVYAIATIYDFPRSREIINEIRSGSRQGISPGFIVNSAEKDPDGDGPLPLVITSWQPYEISSTAIPRGLSAKVLQELPRR